MFDINTQKDLISTLENILLSIQLIQDRFTSINSSDDFFDNKEGTKGIKDKLSHHYFDIDSEIIFDICDTNIEELLENTNKILADISKTF